MRRFFSLDTGGDKEAGVRVLSMLYMLWLNSTAPKEEGPEDYLMNGSEMAQPVDYFEMNWPAEQWSAGASTVYFPTGVLSEEPLVRGLFDRSDVSTG